ncbi:MAG TPA: transketolase [Negativicutes bacterium]|nr:transketolase [Negativicutes bacterium]
MNQTDQTCVNALRFLAVDAVEQAKSGHPGLPLGAAPMAYVLWDRFLKHNPVHPKWVDRDRFILSAGHGSALLYALLHTFGYDLPMDEVKKFRQWESKTPGHPEFGMTPGVEATTGPLGQGFAMGVGMAAAEKHLAAVYNKPSFPIVDHFTYAIVSDGDLMEGVSAEAASLAATLGLGKLIYLYDDNHISIEGSTEIAFTENVRLRFQAYGWQVLTVPDGNDLNLIEEAIRLAKEDKERPSLIAVRTQIGFGSPKQGTSAAHGEPLGADAAAVTRQTLGWGSEPRFHVPTDAAEHFGKALERGQAGEDQWGKMFAEYQAQYPAEAVSFHNAMEGILPNGWAEKVPEFPAGALATRESSGKVMNKIAALIPELIGGSADLAPSTKTLLDGLGDFSAANPAGRNFHFGIREHAMGAMVNGIALHGGLIPYGATFFVFADYMRPALRLAAIMQTHSIFVFTHDSIGVGEDGPTHQPIEQLASLRAIPGLTVLRPADANETRAAWKLAVERKKPVALILTRQKLATMEESEYGTADGVPYGAYIVQEAEQKKPQLILLATGSEVEISIKAAIMLEQKGYRIRVVSMPSWELFDEQEEKYRQGVLPAGVPVLSVEAGVTMGWAKYTGSRGDSLGIDHFGASGPGPTVMAKFGFTPEYIVARALALLK